MYNVIPVFISWMKLSNILQIRCSKFSFKIEKYGLDYGCTNLQIEIWFLYDILASNNEQDILSHMSSLGRKEVICRCDLCQSNEQVHIRDIFYDGINIEFRVQMYNHIDRDTSMYERSQLETSLCHNNVSHWQSAYLYWSPHRYEIKGCNYSLCPIFNDS